jgi:Transcriptional regulator
VAQEGSSSRYEELLETALQLFRQKGYHATSMQDIADGMGLRKASLYHYIAAKEDLLVAIYRRTIAEHTERISAISAGPAPLRSGSREPSKRIWSPSSPTPTCLPSTCTKTGRCRPPTRRPCGPRAATIAAVSKTSSARASTPGNSSQWTRTWRRCSSSARATGCPSGIRPPEECLRTRSRGYSRKYCCED